MITVSAGLQTRVERVITESAAPLAAGSPQAIARWIATVADWNARIDLTAARTEDELVDLMLADALVLAPRLPPSARVVDVGTGAGAPGLPLGLARPDLDVTLVEPLQKRVALLRTVTGELVQTGSPSRLRVVRGRGEDVTRRGQAFDVAVSRATLPPPEWLRLGAELAPQGDVWVLLAREEPPALAGWTAVDDVRYRWPLTGAERRAVRFVPRGAAPG